MNTGAGHDFDQMYLESLREQIADLSAERDALSEEQRMWQDRIQRLVVANTALAERVRLYKALYDADVELRDFKQDIAKTYGRRGASTGVPWEAINQQGERLTAAVDAARAAIDAADGRDAARASIDVPGGGVS